MKCMKRWLGIMMAAVITAGSIQVPVRAAETGETAVEAEPEIESAESADLSADLIEEANVEEANEEDEPEADPADEGSEDEADLSDNTAQEGTGDISSDTAGAADETADPVGDKQNEERDPVEIEEEVSEDQIESQEEPKSYDIPPGASDAEGELISGYCGDDAYWILNDDGILKIGGSGRMDDCSNGSAPWYERRSEIESIVIRNGITYIGREAFKSIPNAKTVEISDSVIEIGNSAFEGCKSITGVTIPDSVTALGQSAFRYCSGLSTVTLSGSLEKISSNAFIECTGIRTITIPESVTEIDSGAFAGCTGLVYVDLPKNIKTIGARSFISCPKMEKADIPKNIEKIEGYAFGYITEYDETGTAYEVKRDDFIIYGYSGSDAEKYAANNGFVFKRNLSGCVFSFNSNKFTYTGDPIEPEVTIVDGASVLVEGVDYTVSYKDNVYAGQASVSCKGIGDYYTTYSRIFTISQAEPTLSFESASVSKYTTDDSFTNTLEKKTDGTVTFTSGDESVAAVDKYTGKVTIKGAGSTVITASAAEGLNYKAGTAEYTLTVNEIDVSDCSVTISEESYEYTGQAVEPSLTVKYVETLLTQGTDYTAAYTDNINAGTATVTVTGIGKYTGTVDKTFTISKAKPVLAFAEASVSKTTADAAFTNELTKTTDGTVSFSSDNPAVATVDSTTGEVTVKGAGTATITAAAAEGTNYSAGSASYILTVAGKGGTLRLEDLTYSFANSSKSFGYPADYVIPLSSYQAIFGNTTKAAWYYKTQSTWGGSCMGFSSTAALLYDPDNGIYPSGFNPGASRIADLKVQDENSSIGMDIKRFIEAMQISQKTLQVKNTITSNRVYTSDIRKGNDNLNGFFSTVAGQTEEGRPVIIAVYQNGGHAILAYKAEDVSGTESRVYVYDNNYPSSERYITLNKDSAGNYTSWSYDMGGYGIWGTSNSGSSISYIPYSVIEHVWANRGDVNEIQNVIRFNSRNVALYDGDSKLAATVVNGELVTKDSRIRIIEDDLEAGGSSDDGYTLLSMPIDVYTVKNLDSGTESLDLAIVDTNLGASVDTTAKEVTFVVDDSSDLNSILIKAEEDDSYSIELNSSFEHGHDMEIKGCGSGETMEVSQESGYISINNCQIMNLTVDGVEVKKYTVSASSGEGGSISPSGKSAVIRDMDSSYTITPDSGYVIDDVKVDGKSVGAVTSYTFKQVRADHTISATFKKSAALPGKTTRGDMFNLANNVKVTWKAVPGAKYYKVYREGVTDPKETRKDPVIVTAGLVGWDKDPGLTNGHAYRYKIVASLTGKGDSSGDSKLAYSKVMYRLKTVVIRSVKNTAPGKVTVKYDRTTSGDSYVLQYSENQNMAGARTKVVLGANNTSYVIGSLKKGKTYYISIRVRKKVNGIDYYTTFGVPKKVTITQ